MSDNLYDANSGISKEMPCPACGTNAPDWVQFCPKCSHEIRSQAEAARAELSHINYLQTRVSSWKNSSILTANAADRIRDEIENKRRSLLSSITPTAAMPPPLPQPTSVLPIVPPGPSGQNAPTPLWGAPNSQSSGPAPVAAANAAPSARPANPSIPVPDPIRQNRGNARTGSQSTADLKDFMQAHGLKLVFALATLLVVFSLRSIIAWKEVGAIAILLVPAALLALTVMFWAFGQRTREENPWAGFVYHGMAALLVAFDVGAMNRYWLGAAGASLHLKPALLLACLAGTVTAAALLHRVREIPYLHLFQAGALVTLYAALQLLRLLLWHQKDFHAAPITLFGAAYLLLAALNFSLAKRAASPDEEPGKTAQVPSSAWPLAWSLWAHLSVAAVVVISSLNVLLQEQVHLYDFAALSLLGGVLYGIGAQMLEEKRIVYTSGILAACGLLFWLVDSYTLLWNRFGFLLLALSAAALALAAYNAKRAGRQASGLELASAWRGMGRWGIYIATALTGFQILARWQGLSAHAVPLDQTVTGIAEALIAGALLLMLARWENRPDCLYGALLAGGFCLVSALEALNAPMGGVALTFMLYGWALYGASRTIKSQQTASRREEKSDAPAIPLPGARIASGPSDWLDAAVFARGAQVAAGLGIIIAALLPMHDLAAVWAWTAATLVLGGALYAVTAQAEESVPAIYASLVCIAYASGLLVWRVSPDNVSIADILAPYALATALFALILSRGAAASTNSIGQPPQASGSSHSLIAKWQAWREPLAFMSALAILASLVNGLLAMLTEYAMAHPVLSLLPACAAALLLSASRHEAGKDALRSLALALLNGAVALEIGFLNGLHGLNEYWPVSLIQHACIGWLLQGWVFWIVARFVDRRSETAPWSPDLAANAMAAALFSGIIMSTAGIGQSERKDLLSLYVVLTGTFSLLFLQTWITAGVNSRIASLFVVLLAAMAFAVHGSARNATEAAFGFSFTPVAAFTAIAMTVYFVAAAAAYFALAFRQKESEFTYLALLPLALGYGLFAAWKAANLLPLLDRRVCEVVWLLAGIGTALAYLKTARLRSQTSFATISALLLTAVYCHAVSLLGHPHPQWFALIMLPFLVALYVYGAFSEAREEFIGAPFRRVALTVSGIALFWSSLYGDAQFAWASDAHSHTLITGTLFAYGLAYAALALYRRTPITVGIGSAALTVAYLHALLTHTALWQTQGDPLLSWPRFSCLAVMAGYVWLALASLLYRRLARKDLAQPLLAVTGVLALFCAFTAFITHEIPGQGDWSLLTLCCASILWLGMWTLETGEMCWHVAAWNLLAAWLIFIPLHLGVEHAKADLYLLPFGIYLLIIGHRSSVRGQSDTARLVWWFGLLTILAPAFLLYWSNSPGRHEVLLIIECVVISLFGVVRRIRAYVSAGFAFAALLTAASIIGHIPNYAGTLLALAIGVMLFVAGFYALTHRETIQRGLSLLSVQWQAWQAWR